MYKMSWSVEIFQLSFHFGFQTTKCCCVYFQRAATKALESGKLDSSNVFIMGGSHGGFLTTHLIGQYPVRRLYFLVKFVHCETIMF